MLGLLLLYFIGKKFAELSGAHQKKKWIYVVLGIATYYLGTFIGGIIMVIALELFFSYPVEEMNDMLIGFLAVPFGLLACWGLYRLLERNWTRQKPVLTSDILDEDFLS